MREPSPSELDQLAPIPAASAFFNDRFLILLNDEQLASFLIWRAVAPDEFEILQLQTIPASRRQGFARRLLQAFLQQRRGSVFLEVRQSNIPARQLYESLGFTVLTTRREYYSSPLEDAIVLKFCSC